MLPRIAYLGLIVGLSGCLTPYHYGPVRHRNVSVTYRRVTNVGGGAGPRESAWAVVPGGPWFLTEGSGRMRLRVADQTDTPRQLAMTTGRNGMRPVFTPDGKRMAVGNGLGAIEVWDLERLTRVASLPVESAQSDRGAHMTLALSPHGRLLASVDSGHQDVPILWDVERRVPIRSLVKDKRSFCGIGFSPDGQRVAATWRSDMDTHLAIWDASSGKLERDEGASGYPGNVVTGGGRWLAVFGMTDDVCYVIDLPAKTQTTLVKIPFLNHGWFTGAAVLPDGKHLVMAYESFHLGFFSSRWSTSLCVFDLETGRYVGHVSLPKNTIYSDMSPDGRYVLTEAYGGVAQVYGLIGGSVVGPVSLWEITYEVRG